MERLAYIRSLGEKQRELRRVKVITVGDVAAGKTTVLSSLQSSGVPTVNTNDIEFDHKLGTGGYGEVWKVRWKSRALVVALKQLNSQKSNELITEATNMSVLRFPYIAQVYGLYVDEKSCYGILMEYCSGGNLMNFFIRKKQYYGLNVGKWL